VDYLEVVRQVGEPRLRTLEDHLREMGWTDDELDLAPSSWAVVGSVVLVELGDAPRPAEVGEALLSLHGEADTVLSRGRSPASTGEPAVEVVCRHRRHGDGPPRARHRLRAGPVQGDVLAGEPGRACADGEAVEEGERVLDMFAGIGYFTLPMARAGAEVTAVEHNPTAFRYLIENAQLNDVGSRVHPTGQIAEMWSRSSRTRPPPTGSSWATTTPRSPPRTALTSTSTRR